MRRTTNKDFKREMQDHIIERLSTDETTVLPEQLQNVVNEFENWYCEYEQRRTPNYQNAFIEFLSFLPSSLSVEFTYYDIANSLQNIYERSNTGEYEATFTHEECEYYLYLVYREFKTLCKKNNVNFRY